jgi:methylmalonyl-CoA/ethylmalonyl-CoA epimerase
MLAATKSSAQKVETAMTAINTAGAITAGAIKVHHLNFVVKDLQANIHFMTRVLGCQPIVEELPARLVTTARYQLNGMWIVLVQPLSEQGVVAEILKEKGEGMFLLSLGVESLQESIIQLENSNIKMEASGARQGLSDWIVQDIETPAALGAILQLCQAQNT